MMISFIICLLIISCFSIEADSQTYQNEYGVLEVYPTLSTGLIRQTQFVNLTPYITNTIDIVFNFDNPIYKTKAFILKKFSQNITEKVYENISGNYTFVGWNNYTENYYDWVNINHRFEMKFYLDTVYYLIKDINVQAYKTYRLKFEYNTPKGSYGKWDLYMKRSSDTLKEAIHTGLYVYIDPYWTSDWINYRKITINQDCICENLVEFPLVVRLDNSSGDFNFHSSGGDIRFVSLDNTTEFKHYIERFDNSGVTTCIVNISETMRANQNYSFLVYYNNSGAIGVGTKTGIFNSDFVHGFTFDESSGSLDDFCGVTTLAVTGNPTYGNVAGVGESVDLDGSGDYFMDSTVNDYETGNNTVLVWAYIDNEDDRGSVTLDNVVMGTKGSARNGMTIGRDYETDVIRWVCKDDSNNGATVVGTTTTTLDTWYLFGGTFLLGDDTATLYVNKNNEGSTSNTAIGNLANSQWFIVGEWYQLNGRSWNGYISFLWNLNRVVSNEYVNFTYDNWNDTNGFMSFGNEFRNIASILPFSFGDSDKWFLVSIPYNGTVSKYNVDCINETGIVKSWNDSVSSGWILEHIYNYSDGYYFVNNFSAYEGYFMYQYQNVDLYYSGVDSNGFDFEETMKIVLTCSILILCIYFGTNKKRKKEHEPKQTKKKKL